MGTIDFTVHVDSGMRCSVVCGECETEVSRSPNISERQQSAAHHIDQYHSPKVRWHYEPKRIDAYWAEECECPKCPLDHEDPIQNMCNPCYYEFGCTEDVGKCSGDGYAKIMEGIL